MALLLNRVPMTGPSSWGRPPACGLVLPPPTSQCCLPLYPILRLRASIQVDGRRSLTMTESRSRTVLLVEDDKAFSYAAARYLNTKGFTVIEAPGSMAALRELDTEGIDVVVADL